MELMYLASIAKEWKQAEATLIDAIAERIDVKTVSSLIKNLKPDLLVSIIGFETFKNDIENMDFIKQNNPNLKVVAFGYYPTLFSEEIINNSDIDMLIRGEPELSFSELYDCLANKEGSIFEIDGLAFRDDNGDVFVTKPRNRIEDLDILPFPDYSLVKQERYSEPFMKKPFAVLQSGRGCPFECGYCVKTYGKELAFRTPENVLNELERLILENKTKSLRFLDDTFTVNKKRVIQICEGILRRGLEFEWSCLSRVDTLDDEMAFWLHKSGCVRVLLGVESGSQNLLDYYGKKYSVEKIKYVSGILRKRKIETVAWFVVGGSVESKSDFKKSVQLAKKMKFDFIAISRLCLYPGTPLFEGLRDNVDFYLFPYRNQFKEKRLERESIEREKAFYFSFYFNFLWVLRIIKFMAKRPKQTILLAWSLVRFILSQKIESRERKDLL